MARTQISIKLDEHLLARVDRLADDVGSTRTAVIEQAIKNDLPEQEAFHRSLENPVVRAIHERITSPSVLRMLARLTDANLSDEEIERLIEKAPRQREAARNRQADRKGRTRLGTEGV